MGHHLLIDRDQALLFYGMAPSGMHFYADVLSLRRCVRGLKACGTNTKAFASNSWRLQRFPPENSITCSAQKRVKD